MEIVEEEGWKMKNENNIWNRIEREKEAEKGRALWSKREGWKEVVI